MGHSLFSPSGAHRWMQCPASLAESQKYKQTTSVYAEEGTRAHDYAAEVLKLPESESAQDVIAGDNEEMIEAVGTYVNVCRVMSKNAVMTMVEQTLDTSEVLGMPDQSGTADFIALLPNELQVHDLKYGRGVAVSAKDNEQLIIYGLAALDLIAFTSDVIVEKVRLVIHQPRLNSVSEAVYLVEDLEKWRVKIQDAAENAAKLVNGERELCNADYAPGEKQCQFCPHKANCEAAQKHVFKTLYDDFEDLTTAEKLKEDLKTIQVDEYSIERLSIIMQNMKLIKMIIGAIDERVYELLFSGVDVPGFKLVEGRKGSRKWTDDDEVEKFMKESLRLKVDDMYDKKVISPAKAEKILKPNPRKWKRLIEFITSSDPKPTVAPMDDKRPAIVKEPMSEAFEDLDDDSADDLI